MSGTKHTLGPWTQEGTVVYIGKTGDFLPNGEPNWGGFDLRSCPLPEANARLIAAAPDLLKVCEEFVRKVECGEARSKRSYQQMKAAIAKAKGE